METTITLTLNPEGKLELPSEIQDIFSPGEQYSIITTEDAIVFKKVPQIDWEELRKRRAELGEDQEEMTMEEICEIVREVRNEMKQQREMKK